MKQINHHIPCLIEFKTFYAILWRKAFPHSANSFPRAPSWKPFALLISNVQIISTVSDLYSQCTQWFYEGIESPSFPSYFKSREIFPINFPQGTLIFERTMLHSSNQWPIVINLPLSSYFSLCHSYYSLHSTIILYLSHPRFMLCVNLIIKRFINSLLLVQMSFWFFLLNCRINMNVTWELQ